MKLLDPEKYHILKEHLSKVEINHHFAQAVLEQTIDGSVYVDDYMHPSIFYIKHNYGMSLLVGNTENEEFNKQLVSYIINTNNCREKPEYLQVYPDAWNPKLEGLLGDKITEKPTANEHKKVIKLGRLNFLFNSKKYKSVSNHNSNKVELVQTDATLFNMIKGTVVPSKFWRNADEFVQQAVGFSALVKGEPVSTAYAAFVHEPYLEIGIETKAEFKGLGFAHLVCAALISYCIKNKFEPVWSCRADNLGSIRLAEKLGFEQIRTIPFYQLPHN